MAKGNPSKYNYNFNENKENAVNVIPSLNSSNKNDFLNKAQPNIKNVKISNNIDNNINNNMESMKNKKYNRNK